MFNYYNIKNDIFNKKYFSLFINRELELFNINLILKTRNFRNYNFSDFIFILSLIGVLANYSSVKIHDIKSDKVKKNKKIDFSILSACFTDRGSKISLLLGISIFFMKNKITRSRIRFQEFNLRKVESLRIYLFPLIFKIYPFKFFKLTFINSLENYLYLDNFYDKYSKIFILNNLNKSLRRLYK